MRRCTCRHCVCFSHQASELAGANGTHSRTLVATLGETSDDFERKKLAQSNQRMELLAQGKSEQQVDQLLLQEFTKEEKGVQTQQRLL